MTPTPKKNGPAKVAALPSRGSTPEKDQNMETHTTRDMAETITFHMQANVLENSMSQLHAAWMACGMLADEAEREAIKDVIHSATERLEEVRRFLRGIPEQGRL